MRRQAGSWWVSCPRSFCGAQFWRRTCRWWWGGGCRSPRTAGSECSPAPRNIVKHWRRKNYCFSRIIFWGYDFVKFLKTKTIFLFSLERRSILQNPMEDLNVPQVAMIVNSFTKLYFSEKITKISSTLLLVIRSRKNYAGNPMHRKTRPAP